MKPRSLSRHSLTLLGVTLGAVIGLLIKKEVPQAITSEGFTFLNFWSAPENWGLLVLGFFLVELFVAMVFRKPYRSKQISIGILIIPIVWSLIASYSNFPTDLLIQLFARTFIASVGVVVMFILWFAVTLASLIIPFIVGIDTCVLESSELLPSSFGYEIRFINGSIVNLIDTIADRLGFLKVPARVKSITSPKLSYYSKGKIVMGVACKTKEKNSIQAVFSFFSIRDDTVGQCENRQEVSDYKTQIMALLNARKEDKEDKCIEQIGDILPQLVDLQFLAKGLGRKEVPSMSQTRIAIKEFPKVYPYWFSLLLVVLGVVIAEVMRRLFETIH